MSRGRNLVTFWNRGVIHTQPFLDTFGSFSAILGRLDVPWRVTRIAEFGVLR
jgi:hypothetical protein